MSDVAVQVTGLRKSYDRVEALRGIDFSVASGEVFALLGPNGAGKTTAVEILEGYRRRDDGEVRVLGLDPAAGGRELKRRIGIVLQETGIEPYLTVEETIDRYRGFFPAPRPLDEVVEVVGLQEKRKARANKLSGGQKRRLDVAIGLAGDPDLLFLDEPTTGFDPSARRNAWAMVKNLQSLGKTVLLTTHYMDEAQVLAGRVAIIVAGKIVTEGSPAELTARSARRTRINARLPEGTPHPPNGLMEGATLSGNSFVWTPEDPVPALNALTGWALDNGIALADLTVARPSLEDVYLELAGEPSPARSTADGPEDIKN